LSVAHLLLNAVSYDGEIWHADAYRPSAGHVLGFMSIGVVVTKIITFFQKCGAVTSGRWIRPQAVGLYQPADWLAGCSSALARYSDVAYVSQSHWPLRVY